MKIHSIWDAGKEIHERYTVIYSPPEWDDLFPALGMSANPFHPQGCGMHCYATPGNHLGVEITMADLPPDCQAAVQNDLGKE